MKLLSFETDAGTSYGRLEDHAVIDLGQSFDNKYHDLLTHRTKRCTNYSPRLDYVQKWTIFGTLFGAFPEWYLRFGAPKMDQKKWHGRTHARWDAHTS